MSIKLKKTVRLVFHFLLGIFFLLLGIYFLVLPWSTHLQNHLIEFILNDGLGFTLSGLLLVCLSAATLYSLFLRIGFQKVYIKLGDRAYGVDQRVIHQYIDQFLSERFPGKELTYKLMVNPKAIRIQVFFPYIPEVDRDATVDTIRKDMEKAFDYIFEYKRDVSLVVAFSPMP